VKEMLTVAGVQRTNSGSRKSQHRQVALAVAFAFAAKVGFEEVTRTTSPAGTAAAYSGVIVIIPFVKEKYPWLRLSDAALVECALQWIFLLAAGVTAAGRQWLQRFHRTSSR
jgi:hypothetical protein